MSIHIRSVAKRTWRSILRITLLLVITLVMISGMMIGTEGGRITLLKQSVSLLELFTPYRIEMVGLRSPGLGQLTVGQAELIGVPAIPNIALSDIEIRWQWQYALQNRWWFSNVQVGSVKMSMTEPKRSSGENFSWLYQSWAKVPAIRVERLRIDEVQIFRPRHPAFESSMDAQLELNWGTEPARLIVGLSDEPSGNLYALQLSADAINEVRVQGSLRAESGSAWADWLRWQLPEAAQASWDFQVDYGNPGYLNIAINDWSLPWKDHMLKASGNFQYDINNIQLNFSPLSLTLDDKPAELNGFLSALQSDLAIQIDDWVVDPFSDLFGYSDLTGTLQLDAQWFGGWRQPRLDGDVSLVGQWDAFALSLDMTSQAERSSLNVTQGTLVLANNRVELTGAVDWLTEEVDFEITGSIESDPLFRSLLPSALGELTGKADITGQIAGAINDPVVSLSARGDGVWRSDSWRASVDGRWQSGELQVDEAFVYAPLLQAKGTFNYSADDGSWISQWDINEWRSELLQRLNVSFPVAFNGTGSGQLNIAGNGSDVTAGGNIAIQGLWQSWPLNAQIAIAELNASEIVLGDSTLQLGAANTSAEGKFSWTTGAWDLRFEHQDWPLATLPPWLPFWPDVLSTLNGEWSGLTELTGQWNRPKIETDSYLSGQWFDEPFTLALRTKPTSVEEWFVPEFAAQWLGARWQYSGQLRPYELKLDGQTTVERLSAQQIPMLTGSILGNEKSLPDALNVVFGGDVALRGPITSPTLNGVITADGLLDDQPFNGYAELGYLDVNYAAIDQAQGQWADGEWQFDGLVDWRLNQMALTIDTDSPNANHLVPWLQLALQDHPNAQWLDQWQGSLKGRLQIDNRTKDWLIDGDLQSEGVLLEDDYRIQWQGSGRLNQALDHSVSVEWGVAEVDATLVSDASTLNGSANIQWLNYAQIRGLMSEFPSWIVGIINGQVTVDGSWQAPNFAAQLATTGQFELNEAHRFNAHIDVAGNQNGWSLDKTFLEIPRAVSVTVSGSGQGASGELQLEGVLPDTQYFVANSELGPGQAAFNVSAKGVLTNPDVFGSFEWRAEQWPIALSADFEMDNGNYALETAFYSNNQTQLKANVAWPKTPIGQWPNEWPRWPLMMEAAINADMDLLDPLLVDQPDLALTGQLQGQWTLTGPLTAPTWSGGLNWFNGSFEHAFFGTRLSDITLSVLGNDSSWGLIAEGTDGNRGAVKANGTVSFLDEPSRIFAHAIQLNVELAEAQLLNQAQMDAALSGNVAVVGSYHDLNMTGDVIVNPLTLQSDSFLWDGAPQLNIVESSAGNLQVQNQRPAYWPRGNWDLRLLANNRVSLYGQGISAELTGELDVTKDLYDPELSGRFDLVRGTYTGLGRVFDLQTGSIQLQNNQMVLDISGEHVGQLRYNGALQPVTLTIRITGTRDSLNLALSSDSNLDQDELLALILFGRIVGDLDVIQAYQLATVINKLRTGDSGFDFIGATRDSFALDTLVLDTESDDQGNLQFNVSAGKYINDFLYLEVEQDVGTEQEFRGSLQYQVTPSTNIEIYTQGQGGAFDDNGIELNWSFDY